MVPPPTLSPDDAKAVLRRQIRALRRNHVAGLDDSARLEAAVVLAGLAMRHLPQVRCFSSFIPMGSEIDPQPLANALVAAGAIQTLPQIRGLNQPLRFARYASGDPLVPGMLGGIPEPLPATAEMRPDLMLVPLLAVDRSGGRLGQGAGFYDRSIAELKASGPLFLLGIGWDLQLIDGVPMDAFDQRLDALVTPSQWLHFG